jgi:hypothetical protein
VLRSSYLPYCVSPSLRLLAVNAVFFALAAPTASQEKCPAYDEQERAWLNNQEVELFVDFPDPACGPAGPTDKQPDANTYLIAPVDATAPQDPGGTFPVPGGGSITVPIHDLTVERNISASQPADCFGSYVLPGSKATSNLVLTRVDPNGSGLKLAYAIKFGGFFRPLTANWIIRAGVEQGLLSLDSSIGYGGTCWTDSSARNPLQRSRLNQ